MTTKNRPESSELEKAIDALFAQLQEFQSDTDAYAKTADQLIKLYKLKEIDAPRRVSPDTLVLVAGNIVGIILILQYERLHVVTSKALAFVLKLR